MLKTPPVMERPHQGHHEKAHHRRLSVIEREGKRPRSMSNRRGSLSGQSSRSPTPTVEFKEGNASRRSSDASQKRKKVLTTPSKSGKRPGMESRSVTPEFPSPLARESSVSGMTPDESNKGGSARRGKATSDPA